VLSYYVELQERTVEEPAAMLERIAASLKHGMGADAVVCPLQAVAEAQDKMHSVVYSQMFGRAVELVGQSGAAYRRRVRRRRRPPGVSAQRRRHVRVYGEDVFHESFLDVPIPARKRVGVPMQVILNGNLSSQEGWFLLSPPVKRGVAGESSWVKTRWVNGRIKGRRFW
jgi:hypothetical protein